MSFALHITGNEYCKIAPWMLNQMTHSGIWGRNFARKLSIMEIVYSL